MFFVALVFPFLYLRSSTELVVFHSYTNFVKFGCRSLIFTGAGFLMNYKICSGTLFFCGNLFMLIVELGYGMSFRAWPKIPFSN